jgi:hypothetical protein
MGTEHRLAHLPKIWLENSDGLSLASFAKARLLLSVVVIPTPLKDSFFPRATSQYGTPFSRSAFIARMYHSNSSKNFPLFSASSCVKAIPSTLNALSIEGTG